MGVLPHFDPFKHLFWLKKKGDGGSKVVSGVYLQLQDGMASEYINVPLNTSLKRVELQVVLHEIESPYNPLRRPPYPGEPEK